MGPRQLSYLFCLLLVIPLGKAFCQEQEEMKRGLAGLTLKYYNKLSQKVNNLDEKFDKQTEKYLNKIRRQEEKILKQLWNKDSAKAKELFGNIQERHVGLKEKASFEAKKLNFFSGVYSSKLDSLGTALRFLEINPLVNSEAIEKIKQGLGDIEKLQHKLNQTDLIKKYLKERKALLIRQLQNSGLTKQLSKLNRQISYYSLTIKQYKELLNNPGKLEERLLGLLVKIPAFKDFFDKHSLLGQLFNLPESAGLGNAALAGLQTRADVLHHIQSRIGGNAAIHQALQQNIREAQELTGLLRNQVAQQLPQGGGSDEDVPDFRMNDQKTKTFLQRIELGANFQNQRSRGLLPVTSDFGLSFGYRLNSNSIIGIGGSYKLGWGKNIRNISISTQGAALRSFIDWKLKGSFFISGGYELNYRPVLRMIQTPVSVNANTAPRVWQRSGIIGISKVVSIKGRLLKNTKTQLLFDFLSFNQAPRTQPLIFRIGYSF
jgi:hypothetical protein